MNTQTILHATHQSRNGLTYLGPCEHVGNRNRLAKQTFFVLVQILKSKLLNVHLIRERARDGKRERGGREEQKK